MKDSFVPFRPLIFSPSTARLMLSATCSLLEILPGLPALALAPNELDDSREVGVAGSSTASSSALAFRFRTNITRSFRSMATMSAFSFNETDSLRTYSPALSRRARQLFLRPFDSARLHRGDDGDIGGVAVSLAVLTFATSNRPSAPVKIVRVPAGMSCPVVRGPGSRTRGGIGCGGRGRLGPV
ncbi:hypothetical protein BDY17DRAFT_195088 [Neohortaea acidophila]|uniref:Uncharacterized protein n=1 Tax=Neohortaea acidophila TaxID=245834 RepID=A0A6A6PKH0_9PEZI|nr:uncharacterized protein BDY17DRAFT_195088 [Neohortaea acidophila]KAF2480578.1 hypothetical protein BDY17DRAFT_195088 [Neohortaea acidophila]